MFDAHANLAYGTVAVAPVPALTGLSLTLGTGQATLFPAVPFNCTVWPAGTNPFFGNAEIIRVVGVVGDTFTIVRAQEGTTAKPIDVGYQIANTMTVRAFTDMENAMIQEISAGAGIASASQVVFSNANGVSFGAAGQVITASVNPGGGAVISADLNSQSTGTVNFSNSNGVSFGLDGAGVMTASVQTNYLTTAMASNRGSDFVQATAAFHGTNCTGTIQSNDVSVSVGNYLTTAMASDAGSRFVNTSAGLNLTNVSATFNSNSISLSVAAAAGQSTQPVAASASNGSFLFSTVAFSNANNVTFGTSAGSIITASIAAVPGQSTQPVAASASNGSFLFSTLGFSNANNVTFGTSAGSIITASVAATAAASINVSAGTTSSNLDKVVFADSNSISFGLNGSTITASINAPAGTTLSSFESPPLGNSVLLNFSNQVNTNSQAVAFLIPQPISIGFVRFIASVSTASTSRTVTVGAMNASVDVYSTWNMAFYKMNVGASSQSLTLVASSSVGWTVQNSISVETNGTQASYTQGISGWAEGQATNRTTQYSSSNLNSYNFPATFVSEYSGIRFIDINFGTSLSAGNYWMLVGLSTSSSANSTGVSAASIAKINVVGVYAMTQVNSNIGVMGSANVTLSNGLNAGLFSTTAPVTTAELPLSVISVAPSNSRVYFQMIRRA